MSHTVALPNIKAQTVTHNEGRWINANVVRGPRAWTSIDTSAYATTGGAYEDGTVMVGPHSGSCPKVVKLPSAGMVVSNTPANHQGPGWTDNFRVEVEGDELRVFRVDAPNCGWGQSLELTSKTTIYDHGFIRVGNHSGSCPKVVKLPSAGMVVSNTPANPQGPSWTDSFRVEVEGDELKVFRVDAPNCGWGQSLKLTSGNVGMLVSLELTWRDQGAGPRKGHLHARNPGGAWVTISTDAAEHEETRESFDIPAALLGGVLELGYSVGDPVYHELHVKNAVLEILETQPIPAIANQEPQHQQQNTGTTVTSDPTSSSYKPAGPGKPGPKTKKDIAAPVANQSANQSGGSGTLGAGQVAGGGSGPGGGSGR